MPLLLIQKIASKELKNASREWDVKMEPLLLYSKYYEIREILAECSGESIGECESDEDYTTLNGRKEVTLKTMFEQDFKNADVLYFVFDTYWMQPMRQYISTKWNVKEDDPSKFVEAITRWSYLMPRRFL